MIPGNLSGQLAFDHDMNEFLGRKNILCATIIVRKDSTIFSDLRSSSTISQGDHQQHFEKASLSDYWCQVLKERKIQLGGWENRYLLELLCCTRWDASNLHFVILFYSLCLQHPRSRYVYVHWYL